jgi:hypothetical protein
VSPRVAISGEISLLWQDVDPYRGDVILLNIIPDEMLRMDTFELAGRLAERFKENGETSDEERPVVVDIVVLGQ